jgi:hypothetical protein
MGNIRDLMESLINTYGEERGPQVFILEYSKYIRSGELPCEKVSLKELYEMSQRYEALDPTLFPKATGELINKKLIDAYNRTEGLIWNNLVEIVPSKVQKETIVGLTDSDAPEKILPGQEYPETEIAEKYVEITNDKWGRVIKITEETIRFDQTGQILARAARLGEYAQLNREKNVVRAVIEATTGASYYPSGTGTTLYSAGNNNLISNTLGSDGIEAAENALNDMTDSKGEPIVIPPNNIFLLVPKELHRIARQLYKSEKEPDSAENAENVYKGLYRVLTSPYLTDPNAWWLGAFKRQFWLTEVEGLQVLQKKEKSDDYFKSDIIAQFRVRDWFGVGAVDTKYVIKSSGTG